jgi:hypothetical protein
MIEFETDELLSMGQSRLVEIYSEDHDLDQSIYLSGWSRFSECGTSDRAIALYDVLMNHLGIFYPWPGEKPL